MSEIIPGLQFISTGKTFAFAFAHGSTANIQIFPDTSALKKILAEQRIDVIHLHEPLMPGINWWLLRHTPNIPKIGTFHAYHPFNLRYFLGRPFLKNLFNKLTTYVAVSDAAKHNIAQFFKANYQIIPNAIAIPAEIPASTPRQGLLFLGRFEPRKGLDVLLQAFNLMEDSSLNLYVIGRGDDKPYKKLISASHQARVHFLGGVDDATLKQYFERCQIFISPARGYESFGIVLIHALSHGLPVIASI
jgi:phosphatidylinositol alpha-mannosyltransferase